MIIKHNKFLKITLVFLLLFLLLFQGLKSREIIKEKKLLQIKVSDQQQQNSYLQNKFTDNSKNSNLSSSNPPFNLKAKTAEILSESKLYNLKLIDFSSSSTELNLNFRGDFNSILNYINYLENQMQSFEIGEFKIKESSNQLFFFVKLKNELI